MHIRTREDMLAARDALRNQGLVFVTPEADEITRWKARSEQAIEILLEEGAVSREGVERVRALLREYRERR